MSLKHETIDVRVSQRILWIGSEAYPLDNISRVGSLKWEPRRGHAIWKYVKFTVLMVALTIGALAALPAAASVPIALAAVALIVFKTIRLAEFLKLELYELNIETSGASRRAVISDDEKVISELVYRITQAINNPEKEFHMQIENYNQFGDNINQFGNQNLGKVGS